MLVAAPVVFGAEAWARWRVDTPVTGQLRGAEGCATSAVFTDPAGRTRRVDLRPWRGQCARGEPGGEVTVWYAAADPSVSARSDQWWWPALVGAAPVLLVGWWLLLGRRGARGQR